MQDDDRHAIGELAELAGVSRRTVRYYVQEGLLPAPLGVGRGRHYGPEHLTRLLEVKALQERGRTLDEIRRALAGPNRLAETAQIGGQPVPPVPVRSVWRRITLAPGVELHVAADVRLPPADRMAELAAWCRRFLSAHKEEATDE